MKRSRLRIGVVLFTVLAAGVPVSVAAASVPGAQEPRTGFYNNAEGSPLIDLLNRAQSSIELETYEMDDPNVLSALRAAIKRGVRISIVKEPTPVGSACKVFEKGVGTFSGFANDDRAAANCEDQQQLVDDVNGSGGSYRAFNKDEFCEDGKNCLQHGKIVILDQQTALVSSGNFNSTNLCDLEQNPSSCNRDYSYVSADADVVQTLHQVFQKDLAGKGYDMGPMISPQAAEKVTVGPLSLDPLVALIRSAGRNIQVENQYLKDPTMNAALIEAANRGVKIEVTVASACAFGKPSASEKKRLTSIFKSFDEAGIAVRMFNKLIQIKGQPGYMHAKAIVVDGKKAWMGSVNGSTQAVSRNREFGVFFSDSDVQRLSQVMTSDFQDPNEESWQDSLNCAEND